jgi:HTH-type transcriptional regulator/antitoxin HigA
MQPESINSDAEHEAALKEIELLWRAEEVTVAADRLDILVTLVEAYEEAHFPLGIPESLEAIKPRPEMRAGKQAP